MDKKGLLCGWGCYLELKNEPAVGVYCLALTDYARVAAVTDYHRIPKFILTMNMSLVKIDTLGSSSPGSRRPMVGRIVGSNSKTDEHTHACFWPNNIICTL